MDFLTKVLTNAVDNDFTLARDLLAMAYADGTISDKEKSAISRLCQEKEVAEYAVDVGSGKNLPGMELWEKKR